MLHNDVVKLGVLCGWMIGIMESTLKELWWSTFQAWLGCNRGRILEARRQEALNDLEDEESSGAAALEAWLPCLRVERAGSGPFCRVAGPLCLGAYGVRDRETSKWHLRRPSHPPRPLPKDYGDLCPSITLSNAEEAAHDFDIPEIVQATFYATVVNDAVELPIVSMDMVPLGGALGTAKDQEESSGSNDPSPPSNDKAQS
ncbi:hypothetical protein Cgig2_025453 [Carnegiea gigantea]|uniref:Uncharacterized protein n=1 Tax=Carnegiea gigantea TaxID=171969 RepID=A0A9Q1GT00_9CARY|nr:hypothetical protein Cgig2_025453 [Carnegiea gigantea]